MFKKGKKRILVAVAAAMAMVLAGCGSSSTSGSSSAGGSSSSSKEDSNKVTAKNIKIGVIYVGDENEGYTEAHMAGIDAMQKELGVGDDQVIEKKNIAEDESCYDAAVDLADSGCNMIFATSFGHEQYTMQAAKEYPDIQFFHATGYQAASSGLKNMHNYFTAIYQARYVSGVVAGLKLNEMIKDGKISKDKAKMGYVGAYPYAEVISGYTSFYLGAKSVCPSVTMEVKYTNSWADMSGEAEVATQLIADGCVLISQHADTTGAPSACKEKGVPCVGYNVDMTSVAPESALTSAANNWGAYYTQVVKNYLDGKENPVDWAGGFEDGAVDITKLNDKVVAKGTDAEVKKVEDALKDGSLHVFDTSKFTIGGKKLEDMISASGKTKKKYGQYVSDGYFHESEVISAPAFDLKIDGITEK